MTTELLQTLKEAAGEGTARFDLDRFKALADQAIDQIRKVSKEAADRMLDAQQKLAGILIQRKAGQIDDVAATRAMGRQKSRVSILLNVLKEAGAQRAKAAADEFWAFAGDLLRWVSMLARGIIAVA